MASTPSPQRNAGRVFGIPSLLAVVTIAGLLLALVGNGVWDIIAALLLAVPAGVLVWCLSRIGRR